MSLSRVLGRAVRAAAQFPTTAAFLSPPPHHFSLHSIPGISTKASAVRTGLYSTFPFSHWGMSTSASPDQELVNPAVNEANSNAESANQSETCAKSAEEAQQTGSTSEPPSEFKSIKRETKNNKPTTSRITHSDSEEAMDDLSRDDLVKLVLEKEQVLKQKETEFSEWKNKFLRSYAEMENVMERTRRDAEISKKFAVQSLLDVADNLGRAASVTKDSFAKIDSSNDTVGAVPILKTLLEGVEMTEKQLAEVLRKYGIEKYDPSNEQFDPNRHNAVFQVPDNSKPPGTVAVVIKAGYTLHERIIRPAEVGVTVNNEAES